jgi:Flp pilus assembly protein TadG
MRCRIGELAPATTALRQLGAETHGAAAVELVLWLAVLVVPLLSAVDVGVYVFQKMQLQIAAQAAVQYVWQKCDPNLGGVPAFSKCSDLSLAKITSAAQSTSLGTAVTLTSTPSQPAIKEGTACATTGSGPQWVGTPSTAIGTAPVSAACPLGPTKPDYITVTASYPYTPVFSGLSVGSLLTTPIIQTAWMRMN